MLKKRGMSKAVILAGLLGIIEGGIQESQASEIVQFIATNPKKSALIIFAAGGLVWEGIRQIPSLFRRDNTQTQNLPNDELDLRASASASSAPTGSIGENVLDQLPRDFVGGWQELHSTTLDFERFLRDSATSRGGLVAPTDTVNLIEVIYKFREMRIKIRDVEKTFPSLVQG